MYYVPIPEINGRNDFLTLSIMLEERGYSDRVLYNEGGWHENYTQMVEPHLMFEELDDAIVFVLLTGSTVHTEVPKKQKR
jgi:hypothetical protein